jgi:PTS system nitrogen regulatory IIA component
MVVLILTSKLGSYLYLKTLASFVKLSGNEDLFSRLIAAKSGSALLSILEHEKAMVGKDLTVVDIMGQEYLRIEPALSVKDLVDGFYKSGADWALVVGPERRMLGVVSLFEVVGRGIPNYASLMGNLAFLPKLRPLPCPSSRRRSK